MAVITAHLENWLKEDVEAFWHVYGERPSPGLRRVVQEWWAAQRLSAITFRNRVSGRRAALRDGPGVWEVVMVARDYGDDRAGPHAHFAGFVTPEALDRALDDAVRFPGEIEILLAENARVERLLGVEGGAHVGAARGDVDRG